MVTVRSPPASPKDWSRLPPPSGPPPAPATGVPSPHVARLALPSHPVIPGAFSPSPPPPPPPLPAGVSPSARATPAPSVRSAARRCKLRHFHWEAIPAERVCGRHNLWTARAGRSDVPLDLDLLEELFGQRPEPASVGLRGQPSEQVSLLDAKKILNLGIFLKQFKRPVQEIVADIRDGAGTLYGAEKLLELTKMLPDMEEVKKLLAFEGNQSRLSEAELFALLLVRVPSYARRLELLVLKEEFFPQLNALQSAIQIMTEAALELLDCEELHDLVRLVLKAGNYMNEGGYAGLALGFHISSLLRLADTKANKPGMDLLHFLALEAEKKDPRLLQFPSKLQHVWPASRIVDQEVAAELENLSQRLSGAGGGLEALGLKTQMEPFLHVAMAELRVVRASLEGLNQTTATLCDFLCEQPESFNLPECCSVFHTFQEHFLTAVQENQAQEAAECRRRQHQQEKQKRRSIATCSARDPELQGVEVDLLLLRAVRPGRRSRSLRGPRPALESPLARERPTLPFHRRHTLTILPPCPEPPAALALPEPRGPATPSGAKKPGLFGQGLRVLLTSPPAAAAPSAGPHSPEPSSGFRFPGLFHKKSLSEPKWCPPAPQASPKDVSTLVGFFRRLSIGDKPRRGATS